jgi:hypothetical protein
VKPDIRRTAIISEDRIFRYRLNRQFADPSVPLKMMGFLMLNPSKADANVDDPTITRCIGFAADNGYNAIEVVNIFPYRATDPKDLYANVDSMVESDGRCGLSLIDNANYIDNALYLSDTFILAFGNGLLPLKKSAAVNDYIFAHILQKIYLRMKSKSPAGERIRHLGTLTKEGFPRHPLYLKRDCIISRTTPEEIRNMLSFR